MGLKVSVELKEGYTPIVTAPQDGIQYLDFGILRLSSGNRFSHDGDAGHETGIVILSCTCDFESSGKRWTELGGRKDVFGGPATGIYLPPGKAYTIMATSYLEAAIVTAPADRAGEIVVIRPEDVATHAARGKGLFVRDVHDIIVGNVPAQRLMIGETFNRPGQWSSYPPHKHDVEAPPDEVKLEEIYFYKLYPPQGFGMQRIYSPERGINDAYVVENNDTILIPYGYHPVAAVPGYRLYYLWALAGQNRVMKLREDPTHSWVWDAD